MKTKAVINCNKATALIGASKGFRINGRTLNEFRTPQISFGKSYGSCEVVLQPATRVLAQISCSVGEPLDSRPGEGIMTVSVWISPAATGDMAGGGSQKPALLARTIEKLFKEHRVVDLESLCIKYGEKVWVLRADVHILDMNGCLSETAALAVLGGLLTFRRPEAYIDKETNQLVVLSLEESTPVKVHTHHLPVLISFALVDGKTFLVEPDQEEEEIFPGKLVVGINDSKELSYLHLAYPVSDSVIVEATGMAQKKCLERIEWLKLLVEADDERKNKSYAEQQSCISKGKVIAIASTLFERSSVNSKKDPDIEIDNLSINEKFTKHKCRKTSKT